MRLTSPKYRDGIKTVSQRAFGGIDRRDGNPDGTVSDTLNMASDHYPHLATRAGVAEYADFAIVSSELGLADTGRSGYSLRGVYDVSDTPYYLVSFFDDADESESLYVVLLTEDKQLLCESLFNYDPDEPSASKYSHPQAIAWGHDLILFFGGECYRVSYDRDSGTVGIERIDEHYEGIATVYIDEWKSITLNFPIYDEDTSGYESRLGSGYKVRVRCADGYDGYLYVRRSYVDMSVDRELAWIVELDFDENFAERDIDDNYPEGEKKSISIDISVPSLEHICVKRDRIWGVEGNRIYACASSDPRHWYRYDGVASDSFYAEIGEVSSFTGICNFADSVFLFTREGVYRMYGSTPDSFSLASLGLVGLDKCESGSFGCASGMLFYNSTEGIVAFDGTGVSPLYLQLGGERLHSVCGIGCGSRYYACDGRYIFVYDGRYGTWNVLEEENNVRALRLLGGRVVSFEYSDAYYVDRREQDEECDVNDRMHSHVELSEISEGSLWAVCPVGFSFCAFLGKGASLSLSICYEGGEWHEIYSTDREGRHNHRVRLSHVGRAEYYALRLDGVGEWRLYSLARSYAECASGDWGE